ncbi:MAG: radical SAM family heme chaperone HemW, partial [Chitinophagaceae bacterium]
HIPFCKKACNYCNFHFSTQQKWRPQMIASLQKELQMRKSYLSTAVQSVYLGGGTPSLLNEAELQSLLRTIFENYSIEANAEITLEANPDDMSEAKLASWQKLGINRLSIGVQSFREADLQWMNRAHTAGEALKSIQLAQQMGFHNLSIDLIYGTPGLTNQAWQANILQALSLQIPHLSCYALTVEPKTALDKQIKAGKLPNIVTDEQAEHFDILLSTLTNAGFEQYEIANFAIPGFRSKHNSSYWEYQPYLGIGPSAHSFNQISRQWNIANNTLYMKTIENKEIPFEIEHLTEVQQLNEYLMLRLRTIEGCNMAFLAEKWGNEMYERIMKKANPYLQEGYAIKKANNLVLTPKGKFLADGIAAALFE